MSEAEGDSSADEDEGQAHASARGRCGQFVWPCPREYPSELQEREAKPDLRPFLCLAVPTDPLQASRPLDPIMAAVDGLIASPLDRGSYDPWASPAEVAEARGHDEGGGGQDIQEGVRQVGAGPQLGEGAPRGPQCCVSY